MVEHYAPGIQVEMGDRCVEQTVYRSHSVVCKDKMRHKKLENGTRNRNICTLSEILPASQVYRPFILSFRHRAIRHLGFADLFVFAFSPFLTGKCESEATLFPPAEKLTKTFTFSAKLCKKLAANLNETRF